MLFLFLFSLVSSKNKFEMVKYSQLLVGDGIDSKALEKAYNEVKKHAKEICSSDEARILEDEYDRQYWIDFCIASIEAMQQVKAADSSNFNKVISDFNKVNEFLIIIGVFKTDIDLTNLKHEMIVSISYEEDIDVDMDAKQLDNNKYVNLIMKNVKKVIKAKLDGSSKSFIRYALADKKKKDDFSDEAFSLIGNVGSKVSFLICSGSRVTITKSDLNAPQALFAYCTIDSESQKIKSGHFIADYSTMQYINNKIESKIEVNQFGILLGSYYDNYPHRITYNSNGWSVQYKYMTGNYYDFKDNSEKVWLVPYKSASMFNLIVFTYDINIFLPTDVKIEKFSPINLTLTEDISTSPNEAKKLEGNAIKITQTGFDNVNKDDRPKITLSFDKEYFEFEKTEDDPFSVQDEPLYSYKPLNKKNVNVGMIVGIVVAVVVVIAVVVVVVIIVIRKKKNAQQSASEGEGNEDKA